MKLKQKCKAETFNRKGLRKANIQNLGKRCEIGNLVMGSTQLPHKCSEQSLLEINTDDLQNGVTLNIQMITF